jgi:hypothetical protein
VNDPGTKRCRSRRAGLVTRCSQTAIRTARAGSSNTPVVDRIPDLVGAFSGDLFGACRGWWHPLPPASCRRPA